MHKLLWVLQGILAFHTATGAIWKFSNSAEQTMPSLGAIPPAIWIAMAIIELACSLALILPAFKNSLGKYAAIAAAIIAAEMLLFCGLHLASGATDSQPLIYWLVVAAGSGFIAYGRFVLKPFEAEESRN